MNVECFIVQHESFQDTESLWCLILGDNRCVQYTAFWQIWMVDKSNWMKIKINLPQWILKKKKIKYAVSHFFFQLLPAQISFHMVTEFIFILCTLVGTEMDHLNSVFIGIQMPFLETADKTVSSA